MTLLICPVRPGDNNEELRYSLRSWEANLLLPGGLELLIVGYKPKWLQADHYLPANNYTSMPLAVFDNVYQGARLAVGLGHEEAIYMNDDFFCLDPVGAVLPVKRNCTLAEHIRKFPGNAGLWWPQSLRLTASWLEAEGFTQPDSYEAHRPLFCKPDGMLEALNRWLDHEGGALKEMVPQWRTIYGVLNKVEAYPVVDAKLSTHATGYGTPWVSTSDQSWRRYGRTLTQRFQKPSRWER